MTSSVSSTKNRYRWLSILNFLALLITAYLTYMHYQPSLSDVCNFGEKWECQIVNQSIYSEIAGIPVSIAGFLSYLLLFAFSIRGLKKDQRRLLPVVLACTVGATLFSLYLTGIEAFVLESFCIFCVAQQIIILLDLSLITSLYLQRKIS